MKCFLNCGCNFVISSLIWLGFPRRNNEGCVHIIQCNACNDDILGEKYTLGTYSHEASCKNLKKRKELIYNYGKLPLQPKYRKLAFYC